MTRAEQFEELRPLLFSIAYRILSSVSEAEDAVQETWLRYDATPTTPTSTKAFLSAAVTRISIDILRSARVRREAYVGDWFPEPLLSDPYQDPERSAMLADSLSMSALLILERLSPVERAIFVLREVFAFDFRDVAAAVGKSEAACRQHAARARRHMRAGVPRFDVDRNKRTELADRFFHAFQQGDVAALRSLLAADACMVSDSGAHTPRWGEGFHGAERIARLLANLIQGFTDIGGTVEVAEVNGQPGAVFRGPNNKIVHVWALEIIADQVQTIRTVLNPDKLAHLGEVADAWEVVRLTNAARLATRRH